ncbi:MAG: DUF3040 domain-containing protein [Actinomycetaceae bacterium]|nr:DUF3040 domain-containing protein [Actinomycetaceae bacterium]
MALSDYEKQILEQMERQLRAEDPELGSAFDSTTGSFSAPSDTDSQSGSSPRFYSSPRLWATVFVSILLGLTLLLAGVSLFHTYTILGVILAVCGFLAMLFAVTLPLNKKLAVKLKARKPHQKQPQPTATQQSFMQRQEEKWDRRKGRSN